MHTNLHTIERLGSVAAGLALLSIRRRAKGARLLQSAAVGLVVRGLSGYCPVTAWNEHRTDRDATKAALGGPKGIHVREAMTIRQPRQELYRLWRDLTNLPKVMRHVESVEVLDHTRSRWTVLGPLDARIHWEAEIINDLDGELVAWQTVAGAAITHLGSVHFRDAPRGGTEIFVHLQYQPVAGRLGAAIARWFRRDAASEIREDLRRLKQQFEAGEVPSVERLSSRRGAKSESVSRPLEDAAVPRAL